MRHNDFEAMTEFFRARLREDETAARAVKPGKDEGVARLQARVLADVTAKRRLLRWVEAHEWKTLKAESRDLNIWQRAGVDVVASVPQYLRSPVIYKLVAAYADHPDFRPEWRSVGRERDEAA
ncbi:DUF6221 family protein [Streptomyces sp. NPDC050564]|uniref:DUF6221 family protein n=1 Tax=Streptomyces sp. NPDC050564 TaxID=3365631 RepID=UPI00378EF99D